MISLEVHGFCEDIIIGEILGERDSTWVIKWRLDLHSKLHDERYMGQVRIKVYYWEKKMLKRKKKNNENY